MGESNWNVFMHLWLHRFDLLAFVSFAVPKPEDFSYLFSLVSSTQVVSLPVFFETQKWIGVFPLGIILNSHLAK